MLDSARKRLPALRFALADAATWVPERAPDLIFANAVLQWLPDHRTLLPRLFGLLAPGGVLAVQMPDNLAEPSHRLMREVAGDGPGPPPSATRRSWAASAGCWSPPPITTPSPPWRRRSTYGGRPTTIGWRMRRPSSPG